VKKLTPVLAWDGEHPEHGELETPVGYCFNSTQSCDETSSQVEASSRGQASTAEA
jgi:hypothetical protein